MSIQIHRNKLTEQQIAIIRKLLYIIPKKDFNAFSRGKYWSQKQKEDMVSEPVNMYKIIKPTDNDNDYYINLPYFFARKLLNINIPNYHPDTHYKFTKSLYESQLQVTQDAVNQLFSLGTTTLNLYTGSGKTVVSAYLASLTKKLTLVLYTNTILEKQWYSTFKDFTTARIWIIDRNNPPPPEGAHVILCMNTRVGWLNKEYLKNVGTVIYDEVHTFCTPGRVNCMLDITPKYIIAASATLTRSDNMNQMVTAMCGDHIVRKISTKPFIVYKYNTGIDIEIKLTKQGTPDWSKITLDQANSPERNNLILHLIKNNMNKKILVLTWRSDTHAVPLAKWLQQCGVNCDYMAGSKKTYNDSHVLVGTIKKIGTGFDEKAACDDFQGMRINMLLIVGSTKSVELLEQIAGRAFRSEFPQIVHFVDNCTISENHWKKARPWYKSRNGTIQEINSPYFIQRNNIEPIFKPTYHMDVSPKNISQLQIAQYKERMSTKNTP